MDDDSSYKCILTFISQIFHGNNDLKVVGSNHSMDFTSEEIEQFIKFILTGEFEVSENRKPLQLTVIYKVKTLESLLITASNYNSGKDGYIEYTFESWNSPAVLKVEKNK